MSRSARNKLSDVQRLESTADLLPALDQLHEFIQLMQGALIRIGEKNECRDYLKIITQKDKVVMDKLIENRYENGSKD